MRPFFLRFTTWPSIIAFSEKKRSNNIKNAFWILVWSCRSVGVPHKTSQADLILAQRRFILCYNPLGMDAKLSSLNCRIKHTVNVWTIPCKGEPFMAM